MEHYKNLLYIAIGFIIILMLMLSNPLEYQFKKYIKDELKEKAHVEGGLTEFINEVIATPESWLMGLTIERSNLFFCSIYSVDGFDGQKHHYLGICNTFFEIG